METDRDRVDLFLVTVAQYEEFARIFVLPRSITFGAAVPSADAERDRWTRIMHGALLRKYLQENNDVFLAKVIGSIEQSMDTSDPEVAGTWKRLRDDCEDIKTSGSIRYNINGLDKHAHTLAMDELYSTLLHGDLKRWKRNRSLGGMAGMVMFDWISQVEALVVKVTGFWELANRQGLVHEIET